MKTYPLTESMSGVFQSWNEDRSTTTYNICARYRLPSTVDLARLDRAIRAYVALHPMCRERLFETDEGVHWGIEPSWTITL